MSRGHNFIMGLEPRPSRPIPIMIFAGRGPPPTVYRVSWDLEECEFSCNCDTAWCRHIDYVERERCDNEGRLILIPNSADTSREEIEDIVYDHDRLCQFMLDNLPIIDMNETGWFVRVEEPL